jgi:predicted AlkP superfamily phosphohydrolase/phosphomutase
MIDSGVMPRMKEIVSRGRMAPMTASLPEISSVSWSTFMTGLDPGGHGIFGFTDFKDASYALRYPSFRDLGAPTIWDRLGERRMRSVVIDQPATYPARPIPGVLISGFVALDLEKAVAPRSYLAALRGMNYEIDIDAAKCRDNPDELFSALGKRLAERRSVVDALWEKEEWNLMEIVVTGTDRLHHFMWDACEDANHPRREDVLAYYRAIDDFLGHVYEKFRRLDAGGNFFMLSDHGFCAAKREVYVNAVLRAEGFLDLAPGASSLEGITERTKAFALDPARIYINRAGRFPRGRIDEADAKSLLEDLAAIFDALEVGGERVVRRRFTGREAYSGPFARRGPDLVLVPRNGFDLKGRPGAAEISGERRFQGMHTWEDAFFFSLDPAAIEDPNDLNIVDVPKTILRSMDVEP